MHKPKKLIVILTLLLTAIRAIAADIRGKVIDASTREVLIGATVAVKGTDLVAATDIDGRFVFTGLSEQQEYTLTVKYLSYKDKTVTAVHPSLGGDELTVALQPDQTQLEGVTVSGVARKNTDVAMVQLTKNAAVTVSSVSAQEIQRTQDSNAGEVIRRVPGVSLIDEKFVMVRGLSQRYNNVWINGGAAPSSEADSRAFSFDLIPSSQIDNMQIIKSPTPEYPADYTGGFVNITTRDIPAANTSEVSLGAAWNTSTAFSLFNYAGGSGTDFLGFDSGKRSLNGGMGATLATNTAGTALQGNSLNNDWRIKSLHPWGDAKLSASLARRYNLGGRLLGLVAAVNYTNEYRKFADMQNNLFGVYDTTHDRQNYLRQSTDNQFNHNVRLGALLNVTLLSRNGKNKYQLKNILNQIGNDRYTWRQGISAQSNEEHSTEYYYRSRTTYNGQLTGKHTLPHDEIDWTASYSYANRNVPDRRRYLLSDALETGTIQLTTGNDISREWTRLDEHIISAAVNDQHSFRLGAWQPLLKAGAYAEYRSRDYKTRNFIYSWNPSNNTLPTGFRQSDITELLSTEQNFGTDGLYLIEQQRMTDNYKGHNTLVSGYLAATLPFGRLNLYAGVRYEHNRMELITNTRDTEPSPFSHYYTYNDLFPSVNAIYKLNDRHQVRLSYGKSVNRPEFREVSPSVFYDFDLASDVQGNTELKPCYIQNVDLRYEYYPSRSETVSIAAFYKYFDAPIEWTYTVTGGTDLVYSYLNAKRANNYGVELDVRKTLDFIGLPAFSLSFNGALIKSKVKFNSGSKEENRPMQGQSPYLVNTGIFYKNERQQLDVAVLYNRIGKRIIGVGRSVGSTSGNETLRVPDSYEMPRDVLDLSLSKRFGTHWELKMYLRDVLAQKVYYKQFDQVQYSDDTKKEVQEVTRCYKPGRNVGINVTYKF